MKKTVILVLCACLIVGIIGITVIATSSNKYSDAGLLRKNVTTDINSGEGEIAAVYKDHIIYYSQLEHDRALGALFSDATAGENLSDREIVDRIVQSIVLLEEAERRGIEVTDSDVEEMVSSTRMAYDTFEGKEFLDQYCEGAGITIDEYFDIITEQMPRTIARQRVKDAIGREYCEQVGIEFTKKNPPAEMQQAISDYIEALMETARSEIEYYVD